MKEYKVTVVTTDGQLVVVTSKQSDAEPDWDEAIITIGDRKYEFGPEFSRELGIALLEIGVRKRR